ncbi:C-type lectin domain family 4 member K isoform X4 [Ailuropoda melanoleuca]|uniref:C-type lectin domain family 4 member K isoform X4 n=1 Tax=Ailuropoda melanoleuca TaxID=9646 RepID=UPI001494FF03|nr:C-type lectin domain family 4 member K isoform X4 [Ailuropoda melanoleuca]
MCTRKQVECQELSRENCTLLQGRNLAVLFKAEFPACRHKAWHTGISAQKESSDQRREKVAKLFPSSALLQRKSSNPRGMIHWLRFSNTGPTFSSQGQNCHAFLEPPPKTGPCLVLRKPLTVQAAVIILTLGLTASVLLQAIFYDILQMVSQGWKYFKENFYYFSQIPKTWYSAQQFCMSRDSHLTSVASENEQEFLYKMAGGLFYWIGLTKAGSEGDWYWVDNTPFDKDLSARFWIPGEPNNFGSNEHCANIKASSLQSWNDASCDNKLFFICKRPYIPSEP